jgi:hypothetical protein
MESTEMDSDVRGEVIPSCENGRLNIGENLKGVRDPMHMFDQYVLPGDPTVRVG